MKAGREPMTASEMGKLGAAATNRLLTKEGRSEAAKLGWKLRKKRLAKENGIK